MLANNSADNIETKSSDTGKTETAVATTASPGTPAAGAAVAEQPKRSIGVKEVIPFAWKLLGDACDGMTMTLYKAVEREEVEAHLERSTRDGHYENLRIVAADELVVQPKVKSPLHFINTPKSASPEKVAVKTTKTKVIAPKVVRVKRKKVAEKSTKKAVKKVAAKKKTKKAAPAKKVKKKAAATKKKVVAKKTTKKTATKKAAKKKVAKKTAPAKKKTVVKKAAAKKKAPAKKKTTAKKKKK